jgi:hypothetical protein
VVLVESGRGGQESRLGRAYVGGDAWTTLKAWPMSSPRAFRPEHQNKLSPIGVPEEQQHAQQVAADQRFQAALARAIAAGDERIEAVQATVQLKRRTKLSV